MTRNLIQGMIDELKVLNRIDNLTEYKRAKDSFLAKAVPLCKQSKKTMPLAGMMKEMLAVDLYIPAKNEADLREIARIEREALADIKKRIIRLESLFRNAIKVNIPLAALALMFLIGGIIMLVYIGGHIASAGESADWPSIEGRLSKISLSERRSSSSAGHMGTRIETLTYGIDAEYDYRVGGTSYLGKRFSFEPFTGDRSYWEAKAGLYEAGSRVNVHYDPGNPESAVLETGVYERNYIFIVMGLAFLGIGLFYTARIVKFQFF